MSATAAVQDMLACQDYVADRQITKVMARTLDTELIRLQCYEGLDATSALYKWNYQRQLLHIKLDENSQRSLQSLKDLIGYLMALRGPTAVRRAPQRETAPGQTTAEPPPGKSRGLHRLKVRS